MKVTTVSATIRYSKDTGQGAWKVAEVGAEATVEDNETWTEAQAHLYAELGCQLKALWANGAGHKAQGDVTHSLAQDQPDDRSSSSAHRHPHADLPGALSHPEGHDAV